ncbi:MAG: hypothetical protein Q4F84_05135 [Fibrobacter sp.]|nr:hypothetical protein [Fibrobacter sp.]
MHNGDFIIGSDEIFEKISVLYFEAWNDIIKNRNWSYDKITPSRIYIEKIINEKYAKKALEIARMNGVN